MTAAERKQAIAMAVVPVFAKAGFAGTTTKSLAAAAGVSEALLYRHFPSKESLYHFIQDQICETNSAIEEFVRGLEPGAASLVKMIYLVHQIILPENDRRMPSGVVPRLLVQSLLQDGEFTRSFHETRFERMVPFMTAAAEAAAAKGELVPGPLSGAERQWFSHHLVLALKLSGLPQKPVFDYESKASERLHHSVWFCLRGMGLKDRVITRELKPERLDPIIDDVLVRAGMRDPR
ncbi:MAG: TetR/AcrR family transcriptional regulator [Synoicihabitans sp.]